MNVIKYWQAHFAAQKKSTLSEQHYCEHHQLDLTTYRRWKNRLLIRIERAECPPAFPRRSPGCIRIELPNGISAVAPLRINSHDLTRMVQALLRALPLSG